MPRAADDFPRRGATLRAGGRMSPTAVTGSDNLVVEAGGTLMLASGPPRPTSAACLAVAKLPRA